MGSLFQGRRGCTATSQSPLVSMSTTAWITPTIEARLTRWVSQIESHRRALRPFVASQRTVATSSSVSQELSFTAVNR